MQGDPASAHFSFATMGCPSSLRLAEPAGARANEIAASAMREVDRLERRYSVFRSDSDLAEINRVAAAGGSCDLDHETADLLDIAFTAYDRSDGLFDITSGRLRTLWSAAVREPPTPSQIALALECVGLDKVEWTRPRLTFRVPGVAIDFGGLVKEYAADQAARLCREQGATGGFVELGGDLAIFGPQADGSPWRIGISDPANPSEALATLFLSECGLASSGHLQRGYTLGGQRFSHLIDPRTGWPRVSRLAAISVVGPTCLEAGQGATIALLKDAGAPEWLASATFPYLLVDEAGHVSGPIADGLSVITPPTSVGSSTASCSE